MTSSRRIFRPGWLARTTGTLIFGILAIVSGIMAATQLEHPWMVLIGTLGAALSGVVAVRSPMLRVEYDADRLKVVGAIRTRIVARDRVVSASSSDLAWPYVTWMDGSGRVRRSPLTALQVGVMWAPSFLARPRRRFLDQLSGWALGRRPRDAPPTGFERLVIAGMRAWELRWARFLAAVLLGVAALALYAWSWSYSIDVIDRQVPVPRRFWSAYFLAYILAIAAQLTWPVRPSKDGGFLAMVIITVVALAPIPWTLIAA